jgi:membrane fusion protein (multidrug efflux system)
MPHLYTVTAGLYEKDKILLDGLRKVRNDQKIHYNFIEQEKVLSELSHLHAE